MAKSKVVHRKGKDKDAVELGRKGGEKTKRLKLGIFSEAYQKKKKSKKKK